MAPFPASSQACRTAQCGATTVLVVLVLLAATLLVLLGANRTLLLELRMSANQVHAASAFEAAEAGLEWAGALLNSPQHLDADCRSDGSAATSFRDRYLTIGASGAIAGRHWSNAGTPVPLQAACVNDGSAWRCSCPNDAAPAPGAGAGAAFMLQFLAGGRPGVVRVVSTGCNRLAGVCRADGTGRPEAHSRIEALLALQPALAVPPATALTLRPATQSAEHFFAAHFGLSKAAWQAQPMVRRLSCSGDCGGAVTAAIGSEVEQPLLWIDGDLALRGPLTLGRADRPVLIVATGSVQIEGAVTLHGVLHAANIGWIAPAGALRGALLSEGGASGGATLDLLHDPGVLAALRTQHGSFVRVPGSWRDF